MRKSNGLKCIFLLCLLYTFTTQAQNKKDLTLEDIFRNNTFGQKTVQGVNWMNNGRYYTSLINGNEADYIIQYDITSGNVVDTLVNGRQLTYEGQPLRFDEYSLNADENKVLLASEVEYIYRRSTKANFFVYDLGTRKLTPLTPGEKVSYATFSPDGSRVAYVKNNDLFITKLADNGEKQVTKDGEQNKVINAAADWVYEEEFSMAKAFKWSPDGKKIAFLRFDEAQVPEYNMQVWSGLYPIDYRFKYPKAGEDNAVVEVYVHDLTSGRNTRVQTGAEQDIYLPRIYWSPDSEVLSVIRLNRLQNRLDILHTNPSSGITETVVTEKSDTYVDLNFTDDLTYLKDGEHFLRTSEKDGYKHIYLHRMDGSLVRQITKGKWVVDQFLGVDERRDLAYFISTEESPMERHLYRIDLKGKNKEKMSPERGTNQANFSPDFKYYILYNESNESPLRVSLHNAPSGKEVNVLENNEELANKASEYNWGTKEFTTFTTTDGTVLNGFVIKPDDFDQTKKYPVLMYVYGGPGSQTVTDAWANSRELWFRYLAGEGYLVYSFDNRGTGARGRDFKHITYKQLGKYETIDQIAAARYLASLPYVDADRIGIWGWSYGGYMSSLSLFTGADVFKAAIAVAPVTTWRYYDTIYTERYLQRPQDNPEGYDAYSPLSHVAKLEDPFLLIHGTADDNVHFQNAVALQDALIAYDKQFESFYYPNRNHGIYGGNTRLHLFRLMTDFLKRSL